MKRVDHIFISVQTRCYARDTSFHFWQSEGGGAVLRFGLLSGQRVRLRLRLTYASILLSSALLRVHHLPSPFPISIGTCATTLNPKFYSTSHFASLFGCFGIGEHIFFLSFISPVQTSARAGMCANVADNFSMRCC
jgi:hypothetical protein